MVCPPALQEHSLERTLDKMQGEWVGVSFEPMPWRATSTSVLRGVDDIQMLLDDQIVKTQSMRASPYIGPFEDRVRLWEAKLNTTQVSGCTHPINTLAGKKLG
jgi:dynein heavy chain